jgi:hypothetical protein
MEDCRISDIPPQILLRNKHAKEIIFARFEQPPCPPLKLNTVGPQ